MLSPWMITLNEVASTSDSALLQGYSSQHTLIHVVKLD